MGTMLAAMGKHGFIVIRCSPKDVRLVSEFPSKSENADRSSTIKSSQLTCLCGEHYVAALLAGSDLTVAMPHGGAARDDLFVADTKRGRPIRLQVKAARDPFGKYKGDEICSWETNCNIIDSHDESLWYAFVALQGWPDKPTLPTVYFVPSDVVASCMSTEKGKSRTFYWMTLDQAKQYQDALGIAQLKARLALPVPLPPAT